MRSLLVGIITLLVALLAGTAPARDEVAVDVELVLAFDVSRSMTRRELEIQRRGYAEAIVSDEVLVAIQGGVHQRIPSSTSSGQEAARSG